MRMRVREHRKISMSHSTFHFYQSKNRVSAGALDQTLRKRPHSFGTVAAYENGHVTHATPGGVGSAVVWNLLCNTSDRGPHL
eukprot:m.1083378 g.1083378  ORF g.1083378 m.1083378 type:complete len:82 (+) comp24269_c1_seq11:207-452(+)